MRVRVALLILALLAALLVIEAQPPTKTPHVVVQWGLPLDRELAVRMTTAFDTAFTISGGRTAAISE